VIGLLQKGKLRPERGPVQKKKRERTLSEETKHLKEKRRIPGVRKGLRKKRSTLKKAKKKKALSPHQARFPE